jgi:hypothetical protein
LEASCSTGPFAGNSEVSLQGGQSHMWKWVLRIMYLSLSLLVMALLVGFTYEQVGRARDAAQLSSRVGQAVDIVDAF